MKINVFLIFSFLIFSFNTKAQFEDPKDANMHTSTPQSQKIEAKPSRIKEKIVVGGGLDLQFGNYTIIGLTPLVGYTVTDKFLVGGIFTYRYFKDNRPVVGYSTSTYGITPFARYNIFKGLFAHVEYEMLYGEYYINDDPRWINSLLVGGGYGTPIGENGFAGIYVLWNVTQDPNYPIYEQPVLRMSFGVGL